MAVVQVGLGISTLLMYVPVHLAATHQVNHGVVDDCFFHSILSSQRLGVF